MSSGAPPVAIAKNAIPKTLRFFPEDSVPEVAAPLPDYARLGASKPTSCASNLLDGPLRVAAEATLRNAFHVPEATRKSFKSRVSIHCKISSSCLGGPLPVKAPLPFLPSAKIIGTGQSRSPPESSCSSWKNITANDTATQVRQKLRPCSQQPSQFRPPC